VTYRCGIGPGLPLPPGPPHIRCDAPGCEATFEAVASRGAAPMWLANGTAPRGWHTERHGPNNELRRDLCPDHRPARGRR
jgi:hypothetical protein